eukprot:scaffold10860_cov182-Amphora_coffeaeformis.AAC.1
MISVCCHAYCAGCLHKLRPLKSCSVCGQKCTHRSLAPAPGMDLLVRRFKETAVALGLLPAKPDASLALTQLPAEDSQNSNANSNPQCLADVHDQLRATRTFARHAPKNQTVWQAEHAALVTNAEQALLQATLARKQPAAKEPAPGEKKIACPDNHHHIIASASENNTETKEDTTPSAVVTTPPSNHHPDTKSFPNNEKEDDEDDEEEFYTAPQELLAPVEESSTAVNEDENMDDDEKEEEEKNTAANNTSASSETNHADDSKRALQVKEDETMPAVPKEEDEKSVMQHSKTCEGANHVEEADSMEVEAQPDTAVPTASAALITEETPLPPTSPAAATTAVPLSEAIHQRSLFAVGDVVQVQARTWPGVNLHGGVGRIKA